MTRLWAVYGTVEYRAGQVLVLTQFADATRQTADEAVDDVEGIDDESETEAPGSIPRPARAGSGEHVALRDERERTLRTAECTTNSIGLLK